MYKKKIICWCSLPDPHNLENADPEKKKSNKKELLKCYGFMDQLICESYLYGKYSHILILIYIRKQLSLIKGTDNGPTIGFGSKTQKGAACNVFWT